MTRTNVVLDDNLVVKCQKETGIRTRRGVIDYALQELLRHAYQKQVLKLKGRISWRGNLGAWRRGRGLT